MKTIIRRFLSLSLSLLIVFSSTTAAYASTATSSWTVKDAVIDAATVTITAVKGSGSNALKSVIAHKPTAVAVGKDLIRGGGALALAYAASQLLGAGIDWILDPDAQAIRSTAPAVPTCSSYKYIPSGAVHADITPAICNSMNGSSGWWGSTVVRTDSKGVKFCSGTDVSATYHLSTFSCLAFSTAPPASIPINTVAQQIIDNAEAGHAESQDYIKAVAVGQAAAGELDAGLDAAAEPDVGTDNPADTDNPPDPSKPYDDTKVLDAIGSIKSMIAALVAAVSGLSDFFSAEPDAADKDTTLPIEVPSVTPVSTDINFSGSCPANFAYSGSIFGNPIEITLLNTAMLCDFLSTYIKWPVYAVSSLFAIYIVGGRKDG